MCMKKILSILLFLILPLMVAVPGYMGWQTQRYMEDMATYIDQLPEYGASWSEYKRGWFKSDGVLHVVLKGANPFSESLDVALPFNVELSHGPVLLGDKIQLGWFHLQVSLQDKDEEYLQRVLTVKEDGPIYQLDARMGLHGHTKIEDRWLPFEYKEGDVQLAVQAYQGAGSVGIDRVLSYAFEVPSVEFIGEPASDAIVLEAVGGDVSVNLAKLQRANVAPGEFKLSIGKVASKNVADASMGFVAKDFLITGNTWLDDAETVFGTRSSFSLNAFVMPSAEVDIQNMVLDVAYKNISLAFIEQYQNIIASAPDSAGPSYWQEHVGALVLSQLLPYSPEISLEAVKFDSPEGHFSAEANLSVEGAAIAAANLTPQNPMAVLPYLIFALEAVADEKVVHQLARRYMAEQMNQQDGIQDLTEAERSALLDEQVEQLLGLIVAQQFIVLQNQRYSVEIDYKKGQALLNGQPMPLPF